VADELGAQAREHAQRSFSRAAFGDQLDAIVRGLAAADREKKGKKKE
jgi:hypothetical protein